ncbi:MAG: bifunctional hydroxymethylpyrimidine kinase/phosphomethylpyrimidine kinase [Lachnospiraceae bacterium]
MKFDLLLYAVTDRTWAIGKTLAEQVKEALAGGATLVQLREKNMGEAAFTEAARTIKKVTDSYGIGLIINDNVQVALACDAAGVHIGQDDMTVEEARRQLGPDKILGVTARTVEQACDAQAQGADYLGVGAVFGSATKTDAKAITIEQLKDITAAVSIPVVAIGGINHDNILKLKGSGAAGAAIVSGIFGASDIRIATAELRSKAEQIVGTVRTRVLTIAGSDCSGGAGIQADLKTMTAMGVYGMSVIAALTAQNTTGVYGIHNVPPEFVANQIDCVFKDIVPDAVKIGMVSQQDIIKVIADKLRHYQAELVVVDPVMVSTSKSRLLAENAIAMLEQELLPLASLITPNIPEAELLAGMKIKMQNDMEEAAQRIGKRYDTAVLVKGGHQSCTANDVLWHQGTVIWFHGEKIDTPNTHGTGCTLSSAIACGLSRGKSMEESIREAKRYLGRALSSGLDLGEGNGPLDHCFLTAKQL